MTRERKTTGAREDKVPILSSDSGEDQEVSRLMETYSEMTNPWVLPTLHLPLFPYWRDVGVQSPKVDVADCRDRYVVTAELPGFEKEDVDVTINGFSLEIKADQDLEEKERKSRNYVQRERLHSSYHRVIQFPQEVTPSKATAILRKGLLEVEVPKIEATGEKPRRVAIR